MPAPTAPPVPDPGPGADPGIPADARYPQFTGAVRRDTAPPTGQAPVSPLASGAPERARRGVGRHLLAAIRELLIVGSIALLLSFVVKTFLAQAFYIPSESMETTLVTDDRVIVSKLTPGLVDLHRGDVVVFADPNNWLATQPSTDRGPVLNQVTRALTFVGLLPNTAEGHLIKRVIGLPGDKVVCCDAQGRLSVNGTALTEPYVKAGETPSDITFNITVPAGRIWVMGDNRGHSSDSRLHDDTGDGASGSVPVDLVVGRAFVLVWPLSRWDWLENYQGSYAAVPPAS